MFKRLKRTFAVVLICTFVVSSYVAWSGLTGREPVPLPGFLDGGSGQVTGTDPDFSDLEVGQDANGSFDGAISVENATSGFQNVIVTVDLFDGDQNVGELWGSTTVKPGTSSSVDLTSTDQHVAWTDAHVDLFRTPS